jgi:hypothetical protein
LQFNLSDIIVIGEFTNSDGPWFDDWYFTFVTKDSKWYNIPQYAGNIEELIKVLCLNFDPSLKERQLANSTTWKSRVSYPKKLRGRELFILAPSQTYRQPKRYLDKLLYSIGFGKFDTTMDIKFTDHVLNEIDGYR